ncbi:MAG: cobalamin biosynthesis protein CobD [Lachnospiraceae bacterium]|nr:cobalamin biosynthesis protein CobD [Lachnospiraceae bacterium]
MSYHFIAYICGFLLDMMLGDPYWLPHPIRVIGRAISVLERYFIGAKGQERQDLNVRQKRGLGKLLVEIVLLGTVSTTAVILLGAYRIHPMLGMVCECVMTYQILATKCLKVESMKVYTHLKAGSLEEARCAVSMIVGRDTEHLDEIGVAKAAIETVAENTSDGSIAPLIYTAIGGPIGGFAYKAINTMDSMVGYRNERYLDFGRAAAKLDDAVNYLPSRIAAYLMIGACAVLGKDFSARDALRIHRRDCRKHASPNSAQTESVCAGALGVQLAGSASYFGKMVEKPYIGDAQRAVETEDIARANRLLYGTAFLAETILGAVLYLLTRFG